jgi:serine/threonine protein kinase
MFHMPSHIGRYEVKTLIGAGGMGSLYLARDTNPNTNRLVALKLLLANLDSGDLRERFARESRALAALNHPNIVDIYDSGEFQGSPFIVMEYVRGETLAEKIKRHAPMTTGQKLKLLVELCSGLSHAHDAGIIHRDIKPANLMVDHHGRLKILDFGIARVSEGLTRAGVQVTQLNMRIGTPGYMSPEQIEGGEIDRRSDIFAVGTVAYELLSYRVAFTGASTRQVENKVLEAEPERLTSIIADLDPQIEQIVSRALAKVPDERYQDATALEDAFERLRWRLGPSETPLPAAPKPTPHPASPQARGGHDSRADAAYHRSLAVYREGAHEAARRFAIEALAEDPDHEGARQFIEQFAIQVWPPPQPRSAPGLSMTGETVLRTQGHPVGTMTADAETVLSTGTHPSRPSARQRTGPTVRPPWKGIQIAAIVAGVVVLVGAAVGVGYWMWRPGPLLTITKPEGGTLSGHGVNCGTGGTDCTIQLNKGDFVYLNAQPDEGYVFKEFTGACAPNGRTTMTGPQSCGAAFTKIPVAPPTPVVLLSIALPTGGTIVGEGITCGTMGKECSTELPQGKIVKLTPLADADFTFKGFTGDCARSGEAVMSTARRCGASFVRDRVAAILPNQTKSGVTSPGLPGGGSRRGGTPPGTGSGTGAVTPDPYAGRSGGTAITEAPPDDGPGGVTPAAPPTPEAIATDEIKKLLEAYRLAYEARDVDRIKRLYPGAPVPNLSYTFKQYKSLEYTYTSPPEFVAMNPAMGTATVKVSALVTPEDRGPRSEPMKLNNEFTLTRSDGTWTIADLLVRPAK